MTLTERVARAIVAEFHDPPVVQDEWLEWRGEADAAIRATLAALRAYRPLSGWTGTAESLLDAFEAEHLGDKP